MNSLLVAVSAILLVATLVNSAAIDGSPVDPAVASAPGPEGPGDLKTASTFFLVPWGGWGYGGGFGGGYGWGGHFGGGYGGGYW